MDQHAILTAIGPDRPGIVEEMSQFIFARGGNLEDSRMVNLRGQFAMMVLIGAEADALQRIKNEIPALAMQSKLHIEIRPASVSGSAPIDGRPFRLTASAMDQSGLVHQIAQLLRGHHVNIESLDTQLESAPITGAPIFAMELILSVPRNVPLAGLRQALGHQCDRLNIDWDLAPI
jgi:glycine cleavage system transcriptional repressor